MSAATETLLNVADLRNRFAGKGDLLRRIVKIFDEQTPQLLARLRHAFRRGDAVAVERTAHTLKGSLAQIGAQSTADLAHQIEQAARTAAAPGRSETVLKDLEAQAGQVQRLLNELAKSTEI